MKDTAFNIHLVEIKRNQEWKELDFDFIEKQVGRLDTFEYKMCMNQCRTEEESIRAIKTRRKADEDFLEFINWFYYEYACYRFIRKKYKDTEDDIESLYY